MQTSEYFEPPSFNEYQDRIVAFIDLQGFASEAGSIGSNQSKFDKISKMLFMAKSLEDKKLKKKMFESMTSMEEEELAIFANGYECIALSDSIVISLPLSDKTLMYLSLELALMQWVFLWRWNFLVRGYISQGKCYHKNGIIFGEAYQRSYFGAEKNPTHSLPYILIQDHLVEKTKIQRGFSKDFSLLWKKDHLDRDFINYAGIINLAPTGGVNTTEQAMRFLQKNLSNPNHNQNILEKYFWTYKYCTENSDKMNVIKNVNFQ